MARYYISDLHFGNKNIIACDHRPFSDVDEMDAEIIRRWNSTVTSRDDVVILGDLAFFSASYANEVLAKLNGHLFLIQGNHDHFVQKNVSGGSVLMRNFRTTTVRLCSAIIRFSVITGNIFLPEPGSRAPICSTAIRIIQWMKFWSAGSSVRQQIPFATRSLSIESAPFPVR